MNEPLNGLFSNLCILQVLCNGTELATDETRNRMVNVLRRFQQTLPPDFLASTFSNLQPQQQLLLQSILSTQLFFFCRCKYRACVIFLMLVSRFFMFNLFLGGVICECIACFNKLEAATTHGFDRVYIVLYSKYGLRCAATGCKGNGGICCRMGWTYAVFGNEIIIHLSGVTCFSLMPFNSVVIYFSKFVQIIKMCSVQRCRSSCPGVM